MVLVKIEIQFLTIIVALTKLRLLILPYLQFKASIDSKTLDKRLKTYFNQ